MVCFPWMIADVLVKQCLCQWMFGIPQSTFDPCPANPGGYTSAWSICTARCRISHWRDQNLQVQPGLCQWNLHLTLPVDLNLSPKGHPYLRVKQVQRAISMGQAAGWSVGCSAFGFPTEITNKTILSTGWLTDLGTCSKLDWLCQFNFHGFSVQRARKETGTSAATRGEFGFLYKSFRWKQNQPNSLTDLGFITLIFTRLWQKSNGQRTGEG